MIDLSDIKIDQLLPSSIAADKNVQVIAKTMNTELTALSNDIRLCLLLPRLDELPDNILDELAWQYHVDFYEEDMAIEKKRSQIRQSIDWHRHKGTPWAVEQVVTSVFKSAKVIEWFDYNAAPYHFKVVFIKEPLIDDTLLPKLIDVIFSAKNTRSWCDELNFLTEKSSPLYIGGYTGIFEDVVINQMEYTPKNVFGSIAFGGWTTLFEITNVDEQKG